MRRLLLTVVGFTFETLGVMMKAVFLRDLVTIGEFSFTSQTRDSDSDNFEFSCDLALDIPIIMVLTFLVTPSAMVTIS